MTEDESYDLDMHLTTKRGLRLLIPFFIGVILVFIGIQTLPLGIIAIVVGATIIVYGTFSALRVKKEREEQQRVDDCVSYV